MCRMSRYHRCTTAWLRHDWLYVERWCHFLSSKDLVRVCSCICMCVNTNRTLQAANHGETRSTIFGILLVPSAAGTYMHTLACTINTDIHAHITHEIKITHAYARTSFTHTHTHTHTQILQMDQDSSPEQGPCCQGHPAAFGDPLVLDLQLHRDCSPSHRFL